MSGNVIKKFCRETSRPSSACDNVKEQVFCAKIHKAKQSNKGNDIRLFEVKRKTHTDVSDYPSCHHYGNFILNRDGLSRTDHLKILSKPKVIKMKLQKLNFF